MGRTIGAAEALVAGLISEITPGETLLDRAHALWPGTQALDTFRGWDAPRMNEKVNEGCA